MIILRLLLVCSCFFGCSSVKKIQTESNAINTASVTTTKVLEEIKDSAIITTASLQEIKTSVQEIESHEVKERIEEHVAVATEQQTKIVERSDQGLLEQTKISASVKEVITATSDVKDIVPWWASLLEILAIAGIGIAAVILVWQLGLGILVRRLIGFIPAAKQEEAKILDEAMSKESETTIREAVAMLRAKDPELNAAFKRRKKRAKL
jgi:hypothetical protein